MADHKTMSDGQRAYEQRRAEKAGKSLDSWLDGKRKVEAEAKVAVKAAPPRAPGLFSRLLDRAHAPLKK